ncbi:hypothetical protein ACQ4PT_004544 [Festuca glaucescens]
MLHGFSARYSNPEVIFTQDPEIEEPAPSRFVDDSILGGPESATSGNASEEAADEISSQPAVPYVGMVFDDLAEACKVYNDYAYKTGFGIRIGNTKYITSRNVPKDTILNRVFECVHTGKNAVINQGTRTKKIDAATMLDSTVDMTSFTAEKIAKDKGMQMDLSDTRQRNRLLCYDCKAHMHVGKRNGAWTITVFTEEHTHPMVKQLGWRRYYRSHRKVPEEDFQLLKTLHNQNISTAQIMGCLGNVRGGDSRTLGYVKRDVSNIRTMLREAVSLRDMSLTIEYFEKRKAESPSFFYATQLDENNAEIPSRYLLHRWSTAATTAPPDPRANTIRFGVPTTNTLKYNALCRKMHNLASDACFIEDTYAVVSSMVDEASKVVANMSRARNGLQ